MSEDKELVEVWRGEFVSMVKETKDYKFAMDCIKPFIFDVDNTGEFKHIDTENLWQGFLIAKRSQKSVKLPNPRSIDCSTLNNSIHIDYYSAYRIHDALTAAGIKYTIGE